MTIFRDLLAIKAFRESKAESAVRRQRQALVEAVDRRLSSARRLEAFRDYATRHEREIYDDLCQRVVVLREIQDVHATVVALRDQERTHQGELEQACDHEHQEEQELESRKQVHAQATRMKEKFMELAQRYAQEELRELERKEDAELEEVAETRRDRREWADPQGEEAA